MEQQNRDLVQKSLVAEELRETVSNLECRANLLEVENQTLKSSAASKATEVENLQKQLQIKLDELKAAAETTEREDLEALEEQKKLNAELQTKLEDLAHVEVENGELVLQISEIQSKYDELDEENKFLKETSAQPDDSEAFKRKIVELEADLHDRNQVTLRKNADFCLSILLNMENL
jgi:chaperonin cofactor prefoldin